MDVGFFKNWPQSISRKTEQGGLGAALCAFHAFATSLRVGASIRAAFPLNPFEGLGDFGMRMRPLLPGLSLWPAGGGGMGFLRSGCPAVSDAFASWRIWESRPIDDSLRRRLVGDLPATC